MKQSLPVAHFRCHELNATLSVSSCVAQYKAANGQGDAYKRGTTKPHRSGCPGCSLGKDHSKGKPTPSDLVRSAPTQAVVREPLKQKVCPTCLRPFAPLAKTQLHCTPECDPAFNTDVPAPRGEQAPDPHTSSIETPAAAPAEPTPPPAPEVEKGEPQAIGCKQCGRAFRFTAETEAGVCTVCVEEGLTAELHTLIKCRRCRFEYPPEMMADGVEDPTCDFCVAEIIASDSQIALPFPADPMATPAEVLTAAGFTVLWSGQAPAGLVVVLEQPNREGVPHAE